MNPGCTNRWLLLMPVGALALAALRRPLPPGAAS